MRQPTWALIVLLTASSVCAVAQDGTPRESAGESSGVSTAATQAAATQPSATTRSGDDASARDHDALRIIPREAWGSRPLPMPESRRHVPKFITLHHAGVTWKATNDPLVSIRNLQAFSQREKNWADVPYHFLIAPDGRVLEGRDVHFEPDTNTKYDLQGVLNVELMGNFEEQRVSPEQLRATTLLVAKLCKDLNLDPKLMRGHNDAAPGQTTCPGRDFHRYLANGSLLKWVEEAMAGERPAIAELPPLPDGPTTRIATTSPAQSDN
jgi:N-acetylmuramoyl-L-alanine amidase